MLELLQYLTVFTRILLIVVYYPLISLIIIFESKNVFITLEIIFLYFEKCLCEMLKVLTIQRSLYFLSRIKVGTYFHRYTSVNQKNIQLLCDSTQIRNLIYLFGCLTSYFFCYLPKIYQIMDIFFVFSLELINTKTIS